eukprot:gb/GECG01003888.1/.p1 GENE.gb/GECG01003888.1/~~gb/GECG01003888.1/.p1  ORF type:complete len:123 (+),score=9.14 gb/GECG01003888.1/:1-369(+)
MKSTWFRVLLFGAVVTVVHGAPQNDFFKDLPEGFDPYQMLGVDKRASQNEIRRAFRKQSLKFHPDKQGDNIKLTEYQRTELQEKFEEISRAYEILGDPDTRSICMSFFVFYWTTCVSLNRRT